MLLLWYPLYIFIHCHKEAKRTVYLTNNRLCCFFVLLHFYHLSPCIHIWFIKHYEDVSCDSQAEARLTSIESDQTQALSTVARVRQDVKETYRDAVCLKTLTLTLPPPNGFILMYSCFCTGLEWHMTCSLTGATILKRLHWPVLFLGGLILLMLI